jgi:hypothetical protein
MTTPEVQRTMAELDLVRAHLVGRHNSLDDFREDCLACEHYRLTFERERHLEHSVALNTVAWKLAEALGDIPHGQTWAEGNPVEMADRLIAELNQYRAEAGGDQ